MGCLVITQLSWPLSGAFGRSFFGVITVTIIYLSNFTFVAASGSVLRWSLISFACHPDKASSNGSESQLKVADSRQRMQPEKSR